MELNMVTKDINNVFSKIWLWITLWLVFFSAIFNRENTYKTQTDFESVTIEFEPTPLKATVFNIEKTIDKTSTVNVSEETAEIKIFRQDMENQVVNHLVDYGLDMYNEGNFSLEIFKEIINRINVLKNVNDNHNTLSLYKENFILIMLFKTLNKIEILNIFPNEETSLNKQSNLYLELLELEKELDTIIIGDLLDQVDIHQIEMDEPFEDEINHHDTLEFITSDDFNREYLLASVQVRIDNILNSEKLLIENKDDVLEELRELKQYFDYNQGEFDAINASLEMIITEKLSTRKIHL